MAPLDTIEADPAFAQDVIDGLGAAPKSIPSRWLYDDRGSALFEQITELPEYYPTRTERSILEAHAGDIAARLAPGSVLVEYGAGASVKTRILLDAIDDLAAYVPLDISGNFLGDAAEGLAADYPGLRVVPIVADFMDPLDLKGPEFRGPKVGFFPGSTIGNLSNGEIVRFLTQARASLGDGGKLVLGADLAKSPDILLPAYDDAQGVTADFNLNLLRRINRELDGSFDLSAFEHEARWNAAESRIEMHLVSRKDQAPSLLGTRVAFKAGETIHTENSRKFELEVLERLAADTGWHLADAWLDSRRFFAVALFE